MHHCKPGLWNSVAFKKKFLKIPLGGIPILSVWQRKISNVEPQSKNKDQYLLSLAVETDENISSSNCSFCSVLNVTNLSPVPVKPVVRLHQSGPSK